MLLSDLSLFPPLSILRPTAPKLVSERHLHSGSLLSPSQTSYVKEWFRNHPNEIICRALKNKRGEISDQPHLKSNFSVLFDRKNNLYWVKYYGEKKNKLVGKGGEGTVKLVQNMETLKWYVLKTRKPGNSKNRALEQEIFINEYRMHKLLGRSAYTFASHHRWYLIQEFINGKNIFDAAGDILLLDDARSLKYVRLLLDEYKKLSALGIIHRDLKPENILINFKEQEISIIDLAFAITHKRLAFKNDPFTSTGMGSPLYFHPSVKHELYKNKKITYDSKTDIYGLLVSVGLLLKMQFYADAQDMFIERWSSRNSSSFVKREIAPQIAKCIAVSDAALLPTIDALICFFDAAKKKVEMRNNGYMQKNMSPR